MRLLLVEDNEELSRLLVDALIGVGFAVDAVSRAEAARLALDVCGYAAVVLDLGLPDDDGLGVLAAMRHRGDTTPVLILTARGAIGDRVKGLRAGADDYLTKPFAFDELHARLEAVLRRPGELLGHLLRCGGLTFDLGARQVALDGTAVPFFARERDLLEILMRRKGRVVQKQHLESQIYGMDSTVGSNALDVLVHRLRKRLDALGAGVVIHTVRGVGFMLAEGA
jgi:DNA-binding response OmpR family regulator